MIFIEEIRIKNFQTIRNLTLKLNKGLNVFTARNNTGKSTIFNAIKVSTGMKITPAEIKQYITFGERESEFVVFFSDGSVGGVYLVDKTIHYLYGETKDSVERLTDVSQVYLRKMGIITHPETSYILNVLEPSKPKIYIDADTKTNYALTEIVARDQRLINASELVEEKIKEVTEYEKLSGHISDVLADRVHNFVVKDTAKIESSISTLSTYNQMITSFMELSVIENIKPFVPIDESLAEALTGIDSIARLLDSIEPQQMFDYDSVLKVLDVIVPIRNSIGIVDLQNVIVLDPVIEKYNFVELLNTLLLSMSRIEEVTETGVDIDSVIAVDKLAGLINTIQEESNEHLNELEEQLLLCKEVVECPVRGRVLFMEGGCLDV